MNYKNFKTSKSDDTQVIELMLNLLGEKKVDRQDRNSFVREQAEIVLKKIYASIKVIIFGHGEFGTFNQQTTLLNPDVSELSLPMSRLKRIEIYTKTYDFRLMERFITYAVNYIGQKHLKKKVEVHIYGDPEKLHPNLRNSFENLCKSIAVHEADS